MHKTALLFDFDGTIADTLSACIDIVNSNRDRVHIPEIKPADLPRLKGMTPLELIKEFHVPLYLLPFYILEVQKRLTKEMHKIPAFKDMPEVLHALKQKGYVMGIITSNSQKNVEIFLKAHEIDVFDFVSSEKHIFGKHQSINHVIAKYKWRREEVLYIGDEQRDIEAAKKSGINCASVTWGFNNGDFLQKYHPTYLVNSPKELLSVL